MKNETKKKSWSRKNYCITIGVVLTVIALVLITQIVRIKLAKAEYEKQLNLSIKSKSTVLPRDWQTLFPPANPRENGAYELNRAFDIFDYTSQKYETGSDDSYGKFFSDLMMKKSLSPGFLTKNERERLNEIIAELEDVIFWLDKGLERKHFFFTTNFVDGYEALLPYITSYLKVQKLINVRLLVACDRGDYDAAYAELKRMALLALSLRDDPIIVGHFTAVTFQRHAVKVYCSLMEVKRPTRQFAGQFMEIAKQMGIQMPQKIWKIESLGFLLMLQNFKTHQLNMMRTVKDRDLNVPHFLRKFIIKPAIYHSAARVLEFARYTYQHPDITTQDLEAYMKGKTSIGTYLIVPKRYDLISTIWRPMPIAKMRIELNLRKFLVAACLGKLAAAGGELPASLEELAGNVKMKDLRSPYDNSLPELEVKDGLLTLEWKIPTRTDSAKKHRIFEWAPELKKLSTKFAN